MNNIVRHCHVTTNISTFPVQRIIKDDFLRGIYCLHATGSRLVGRLAWVEGTNRGVLVGGGGEGGSCVLLIYDGHFKARAPA